jgi:uncharacterized protein YndB with AHSA1/START domain
VSFRFLKEKRQKDKDHEVIGKVVSFIPNKELSYTWNFTTKPEYRKDTIVTWKLEQIGNGGMVIIQIYFQYISHSLKLTLEILF